MRFDGMFCLTFIYIYFFFVNSYETDKRGAEDGGSVSAKKYIHSNSVSWCHTLELHLNLPTYNQQTYNSFFFRHECVAGEANRENSFIARKNQLYILKCKYIAGVRASMCMKSETKWERGRERGSPLWNWMCAYNSYLRGRKNKLIQ